MVHSAITNYVVQKLNSGLVVIDRKTVFYVNSK